MTTAPAPAVPVSAPCTIQLVETGRIVAATPDAMRDEFDRTGVVIVPDFLRPDELPPLRESLTEYYRPIADKATEMATGGTWRRRSSSAT